MDAGPKPPVAEGEPPGLVPGVGERVSSIAADDPRNLKKNQKKAPGTDARGLGKFYPVTDSLTGPS